ncbi:MAG: TatD family nuclease-associated radical SAM protein [Methanoregula sp.]
MANEGTIAYKLCGNIYLNITNRCNTECIFCKKRNSLIPDAFCPQTEDETCDSLPKIPSNFMSIDDVVYGYNIKTNDPIYGRDLRLKEEPKLKTVINELAEIDFSKFDEVVFTGLGEPIIRFDDVLAITKELTNHGASVRLDTIGYANLLYPKRDVAKELADSGMKKISISLNAHDEVTFNRICQPKIKNGYSSRFEFAKDVTRVGMGLRFTIIDLPCVDINKCRQLSWKYQASFKVRPFF